MKELQAEATKPRYIHNNIRPSKAKSQTSSTYKFEKIAEERGGGGCYKGIFFFSENRPRAFSREKIMVFFVFQK